MVDNSSTRILVIAIRAIGDVVLISPLLPVLKKTYPSGYLAVLVDGPTAEVLARNPSIDRLIPINRSESQRETSWKRGQNWVHLIRDIRNERFDVVIDVFSGPRSAILSYLSGASERYGEDFRNRGRGFLYNHPIKVCRDGRHLIEQKFDLVKALLEEKGLQVGKLEFYLAEKERQQGQYLLGETRHGQIRRIGLIPNAGSIWRVWPAERFAELADCLIQKFGVEVILLGGGNDVEVCSKICGLMKEKPRDLSGKTTLRELMADPGAPRTSLAASQPPASCSMSSAPCGPMVGRPESSVPVMPAYSKLAASIISCASRASSSTSASAPFHC